MAKLSFLQKVADKASEATSKLVEKAKEIDLNEVKNQIGEAATKTANAAKETTSRLVESAKEIDLQDVKNQIGSAASKTAQVAKETTGRLVESAKDVDIKNVKKSMSEMATKGSAAVVKFLKNENETTKKIKEVLGKEKTNNMIYAEDAVKIIYLMMMVDGEVAGSELEKYESILQDAGETVYQKKDEIIHSCELAVSLADEDDYYDYIRTEIAKALAHSLATEEGDFKPKQLLWNLMIVAHSDESYANEEAKLIRYIAKELGIEASITSEFEHSYRTMMALNDEEEYLKKSDRQYIVIEKNLALLEERKKVVLQSIYDMILDD